MSAAGGDMAFQQGFDEQSTPVGVRIAGLLCLAVGMTSIKTTLDHFLNGTFRIELGVLGLLLGKRLLEGNPSYRLWAIFLSGFGALVSTGFVIWLAYDYSDSTVRSKFAFAAAHHALIAASAIFVLCTLLRGDIRDWFLMPRMQPARAGSWALPVSIVLGVLLARQLITDQSNRQDLLSFFHLSTTIRLRDAATGEPLQDLRYDSDALKSAPHGRSPLPRLSARLHISPDGAALKLDGTAREPLEVIFNSAGYSSQTVHLTRSTPETFTLDMERQP